MAGNPLAKTPASSSRVSACPISCRHPAGDKPGRQENRLGCRGLLSVELFHVEAGCVKGLRGPGTHGCRINPEGQRHLLGQTGSAWLSTLLTPQGLLEVPWSLVSLSMLLLSSVPLTPGSVSSLRPQRHMPLTAPISPSHGCLNAWLSSIPGAGAQPHPLAWQVRKPRPRPRGGLPAREEQSQGSEQALIGTALCCRHAATSSLA